MALSAIMILPKVAVICCFLISVAYVTSLYVWPYHPGGRQHPTVIVRRCISVAGVSALAWLPAAMVTSDTPVEGPEHTHSASMQLLGIRSDGVLAAATMPLLATALLFMGPLLHLLSSRKARSSHPLAATLAAAARGEVAAGLQLLRDLVVAPAAEEWVFRACMVPLLWLAGFQRRTIILVTPLFFGSAHLHHLRELTRVHGLPFWSSLAVVLFQFTYTTVFGWLATWLFLSTGHAIAPMLVHAACNAMGMPPFGEMGPLLLVATVAGVGMFWKYAAALLDPGLYDNRMYA